MVFKNKKNVVDTKEDELVVQCSCGTHAFHIKSFIDDPEYYFEIWTCNFYGKQKEPLFHRIGHRLKMVWYAIINKDFLLDDIILEDADIDKIIEALTEMKNNKQEVKK